jgi:hypothetical protein
VDRAAAAGQLELTIIAETNAVAVQKLLAQAALAWTILPPVAIADDLARGACPPRRRRRHLAIRPVAGR